LHDTNDALALGKFSFDLWETLPRNLRWHDFSSELNMLEQ